MEWNKVSTALERLVVDNGCLNEAEVTELDFSALTELQSIEIGSHSCKNVIEVKMVGLHKLEMVTIGTCCFVPPSFRKDSIRRHFCLKDCEQLKELKIGSNSFVLYCIFEIERAFSLEKIELGYECFSYSSLELKGLFSLTELRNRPAKIEIRVFR